MRININLILVLSTLPLLQGCIPAVIVGGSAELGTTLAEERKFSEVVSDTEINATITAKWMDHDPKINQMVGLQVRQGRVLLTGLVDTPLRQIDAVRIAWEARGVKEVIDETKVGSTTASLYASDSWITTKLKSEMLFDQNISSVNYTVKTVDGVVYLIGIAQNQSELNSVLGMARGISGVKNVVSHVRLKNSTTQTDQFFPSTTPNTVTEAEPIVAKPAYGGGSFPAPRAQ